MIIHSRQSRTGGGVLVVTLMTVAILTIVLGGFLRLLRTQNDLVARSQAWNSALVVAEAGIEESLAQMNPGAATAVDLWANGWGPPANGFYGPVSRTLSNGTYKVVFTAATPPVIYSTGTVSFAGCKISRVVRVSTATARLFNVAFAARYDIKMNGSGLSCDSFNSADPNLSTGGKYDPAKTSTNGNVPAYLDPLIWATTT